MNFHKKPWAITVGLKTVLKQGTTLESHFDVCRGQKYQQLVCFCILYKIGVCEHDRGGNVGLIQSKFGTGHAMMS